MERDILVEVNHPFIVKLHYGKRNTFMYTVLYSFEHVDSLNIMERSVIYFFVELFFLGQNDCMHL